MADLHRPRCGPVRPRRGPRRPARSTGAGRAPRPAAGVTFRLLLLAGICGPGCVRAAQHGWPGSPRRGYGSSPDIDRSDYAVDAGDIAALLMEEGGAHLVGHSCGGVAAMLAAARVPDRVKSLTLIEPGCYQAAADDPVVAAAVAANREGHAKVPLDLPAEIYLRAATESVGLPPLPAPPERLRAARSANREKPCWEAEIRVATLRDAALPKLVTAGTWQTAPDLYRQRGGEPLMACARVTARKIGAAFRQVPGAHHYPHVDSPSEVNTPLAEFWAQAESDRPEARPPGRHCPRSNRALLHFRSRQYRTAISAKVAGQVAAGLAGCASGQESLAVAVSSCPPGA
jgi:pimeloyl-ACP methyl ester carboxylesterase